MRAEVAWWLGILAWVAMVILWRPDPPVSYLDAPSADPGKYGFAIFHDLLEKETVGVRRSLGRASQLQDDVGVLLVISPNKVVPEAHRREMMDWVSSTGGTLVLGYPIDGDEGARVTRFYEDGMWPISEWEPVDFRSEVLNYLPSEMDAPRDVVPFVHEYSGELSLSEFGAEVLLMGEEGSAAVTRESYGSGTVIQLAASSILGNRSLGEKNAHLFAAALIDEIGRDKIWVFDEAHEGIENEPSLVRLLGSGRWRPVFLQVLLLGLFFYWWRASRIGKPRAAPDVRRTREVTTLARDVGDFYMRSGRSGWALARCLEYFKIAIKEKGVAGEERQLAMKLVAEAGAEVTADTSNVERHVVLIKKMALGQRKLADSSKGKKQ